MEVFVARQPILDRNRHLYGYELLYRSASTQTAFEGIEAASATSQVISGTVLSIGLENVLCGKKAFINFNHRLLSDGLYLLLPKQATVIEILETVEPTADLIALCRRIHEEGYTIALDDFVSSPEFEPLTELAQVIKVDVQATTKAEQQRLLRTYQPRGIALLAEKVETHEEFEWSRAAGYDYFQGYFFARPNMMQSHQVPASKLNCLRLLTEIQKEELDLMSLGPLIRVDVALTYKLLRYVNSAIFNSRREIYSIEHALAIVGTDNFRRWAVLAALPMLTTDKPGELATLSIVRARFCELLIEVAGVRLQNEAFLMGMLSCLDALLDRPLDEALLSLGVRPEIAQALLGTSPGESILARIYRLTRRYEAGDWDEVETLAQACGFPGSAAGSAYVEATRWTERMLRGAATS